MELSTHHLSLRLCRLKGAEEMELNGRGFCFAILKGGSGSCQCGPSSHRLGSGDVLVVDRSSRSKIQVQNNGELVFWSFVAEFEQLFPLFSGPEVCMLQHVMEGFKAGRVYSGSSPLAKECLRLIDEVPAQFSLDHRSHVLRIVSAILTFEFKAKQPKLADCVPMRDKVLRAFERLETDDLLNLSVGELAKKFNCGRRHLNRLFHQHFGLSVAAMRMEMRLLKAVSLLVDPDIKIISVAEKCGFNHLGLFNTCFKKRFGASPSQWRKVFTQTTTNPTKTEATGCPFQAQAACGRLEKCDGGLALAGQARPLERVPLCGFFKGLAAVKSGIGLPTFGRKEVNRSVYPLADGLRARISVSA